MNLDDPYDRLDIVEDLGDYALSIIDKMANDSDTDVNDWCKMHRLRERLFTINRLIVAEDVFCYALYEMNNMKQSDEDSKWTFPLEKHLNSFFKEIFLPAIDVLVDCSRSWSFEDYRARNFQDKLRQKMEMLRDWYKEQYELEDDDE